MNRRQAIAGMIGAAVALPLAVPGTFVEITSTGPAKISFPLSHGGCTVVTFFRDGVVMGRYEGQREPEGKPLEDIWRENGYRFV